MCAYAHACSHPAREPRHAQTQTLCARRTRARPGERLRRPGGTYLPGGCPGPQGWSPPVGLDQQLRTQQQLLLHPEAASPRSGCPGGAEKGVKKLCPAPAHPMPMLQPRVSATAPTGPRTTGALVNLCPPRAAGPGTHGRRQRHRRCRVCTKPPPGTRSRGCTGVHMHTQDMQQPFPAGPPTPLRATGRVGASGSHLRHPQPPRSPSPGHNPTGPLARRGFLGGELGGAQRAPHRDGGAQCCAELELSPTTTELGGGVKAAPSPAHG